MPLTLSEIERGRDRRGEQTDKRKGHRKKRYQTSLRTITRKMCFSRERRERKRERERLKCY